MAGGNASAGDRWSHDHLKLTFHLYCQTPFGKLHGRNPEIIEFARLIGRTANAVAMKLVNFASLDPTITGSGRVGLGNVSSLDREVWEEFHSDWDRLAIECDSLYRRLQDAHGKPASPDDHPDDWDEMDDFTGETRSAVVNQRIRQRFFRKTVLSGYQNRCCMSGISEPRLLVASHIVPWHKDKKNRLNPRNGICLSAIHDRAFDQHLISLTDDLHILIGKEITRSSNGTIMNQLFIQIEGKRMTLPERFIPEVAFVSEHRRVFEEVNQ